MSYNLKKLIDILVIFARNNQELTKLRINKLLYFMDKLHLQKYGRLVLNDRYVSLRLGPVAELTNNIINDFIESELYYPTRWGKYKGNILSEFFRIGKNKRGHDMLILKKESEFKTLSKSEKEVINEVIAKYGRKKTSDLVNITHRDVVWRKTEQTNEIDYKLFLEGLPKDKKELLSEIIELDRENEPFLSILCNG